MEKKLTDQQYQEVQTLKRQGLPEWQAVAQVLDLPEDARFVTLAAGTSSRPEDGLWIRFF